MKVRRPRYDLFFRISLMLFIIALIAFVLSFLARLRIQYELNKTLHELDVVMVENQALKSSFKATSCVNESNVSVCSGESFKSWMPYTAITNKSSDQWALQLEAVTDKNYGFRMIDGYILVAMGSEYGPVGTKYIIQFEDKKVINAMIGDIKHEGCTSTPDGSMIEFIVDKDIVPESIVRSGNFNDLFKGVIISIALID